MAEPLKYMYNPEFFEKLCPLMRSTIPGFDCRNFTFRVFDNQWPDLELKQRIRHITLALAHYLPSDFPSAAPILVKLAQTIRKSLVRDQDFATIFIPDYVEVFGLEHPDEALAALEEITQLVSGEFAVRHFIICYPEKTMATLLRWSKHPVASVRRLASEGCRPRLPWAIGLPEFKKDPSPVLPILENLREDPSEYVRRSVANNLNDIAKDHPELVLRIAKKWSGKNSLTDALVRHACRTLLKHGNEQALSLHGFNPKVKAKVSDLVIQKKKISIGSRLDFSFNFINREINPCEFRLEYAIHYVTGTGKISKKVFQLSEQTFQPKRTVSFSKNQSFKNLTTRKHFKGKHQLDILVNGKVAASDQFYVR